MRVVDANPVRPNRPKRVAIIVANPSVSPTSGWPLGFWWSELTPSWFALRRYVKRSSGEYLARGKTKIEVLAGVVATGKAASVPCV